MDGITLDKFELGNEPPRITFVNVDQDNDDEVRCSATQCHPPCEV